MKRKEPENAINRGTFVIFLVHLSIQLKPEITKVEAFHHLIENAVKPLFRSFDFARKQDLIKNDAQLNQLLFDNISGLRYVYHC